MFLTDRTGATRQERRGAIRHGTPLLHGHYDSRAHYRERGRSGVEHDLTKVSPKMTRPRQGVIEQVIGRAKGLLDFSSSPWDGFGLTWSRPKPLKGSSENMFALVAAAAA